MSGHVLVCDDESHIRRAIEMKLSRGGLEVETAVDGRDALERAGRRCPALVVSDLQMPHVDGLQLCRALRDDPATAEVPFLLLTAKGFELDEASLHDEYGVARLFLKPFSPRELLATVNEMLGTSAAEPSRPTSSANAG